MNFQGWVVWSTLALITVGTGAVRRAGWLDRVVLHYKNKFIEDFKQLAPINIQASIEKAPSGYVDSPEWDFESVTRLLALIRQSETARPVHASLRRMLAPTRRFMSKQKSYKFFPSLAQKEMNNFYYDDDIDEDYIESDEGVVGGVPPDNAVVQVRNPVEARLPSARISVKLLRDILEARAIAARKMPPKKAAPSLWTWPTTNATTKAPSTHKAHEDLSTTGDGLEDTSKIRIRHRSKVVVSSKGGNIPSYLSRGTLSGGQSTIGLLDPRWICTREKPDYDAVFHTLKTIDDKVTGTAAKPEMLKSELPNDVLGRIWNLSDANKDHLLNEEEFTLAMHLIRLKKSGRELPDILPGILVPPFCKNNTSAEIN